MMAGMIDFSTLKHYIDKNENYYTLTMEGYSIKEYLHVGAEDGYVLYLPLLGTFGNLKVGFSPDDIYEYDLYTVRLDVESEKFTICRNGSTGWL